MTDLPVRLYIAGPITLGGTNDKDSVAVNLRRFHAAARALRAAGYLVENPAENDGCDHLTWRQWMNLGIAQLIRCDGVALLPNWARSSGATLEADLGQNLGMPALAVDDWLGELGRLRDRELLVRTFPSSTGGAA